MSDRVHIFGASGSGTTTLGKALAERSQTHHLDVDDFYGIGSRSGPFQPKKLLLSDTHVPDAIAARPCSAKGFYWKVTDPPFVVKNEPADRVHGIKRDVFGLDGWVLSGSLCGWGDGLLGYFMLAVFLYLAPAVRMARLESRERMRYGARIEPGGEMCDQHVEFMTWAESYDTATAPVRSLDLHEHWMKQLRCPVVRLDSSRPIEGLLLEIPA